jgi:hypothetical protein
MNIMGERILWIGPGMGDAFQEIWWKTFHHLTRGPEATLNIEHLKLIDLKDAPKLFYGKKYAAEEGIVQEAIRGDFFKEEDNWDIIILDFIEAWQLGRTYWPTFAQTPYKFIQEQWVKKLKELRPFQVWVRHDADMHSTIIPDLSPEYELVVTYDESYYGGLTPVINIEIDDKAKFWNRKAIESLRSYLSIWQRKEQNNPIYDDEYLLYLEQQVLLDPANEELKEELREIHVLKGLPQWAHRCNKCIFIGSKVIKHYDFPEVLYYDYYFHPPDILVAKHGHLDGDFVNCDLSAFSDDDDNCFSYDMWPGVQMALKRKILPKRLDEKF